MDVISKKKSVNCSPQPCFHQKSARSMRRISDLCFVFLSLATHEYEKNLVAKISVILCLLHIITGDW